MYYIITPNFETMFATRLASMTSLVGRSDLATFGSGPSFDFLIVAYTAMHVTGVLSLVTPAICCQCLASSHVPRLSVRHDSRGPCFLVWRCPSEDTG